MKLMRLFLSGAVALWNFSQHPELWVDFMSVWSLPTPRHPFSTFEDGLEQVSRILKDILKLSPKVSQPAQRRHDGQGPPLAPYIRTDTDVEFEL